MRVTCDVEFATLIDFAEDTIEPETSAELELHLTGGCSRCQRELDWVRRTTELMRADNSVAPPAWVFEIARGLFKKCSPNFSTLRRRIAAALLFDSSLGAGLQISAMGVRNAGSPCRQLLFGTEDFDIDFLLEETEGYDPSSSSSLPLKRLWCQIMPRGLFEDHSLAYEISIIRGHERILTGRANPSGEFTVDDLPRGTYDFSISLENGDLVIEGLDI